MKKTLILLLSLCLLSACGQKYDTVDSEAEANKINKENVKEQVVDVPYKVYFDLNKANLKKTEQQALDTVAKWLDSEKNIKIVVEGHCDERGTREYNLALGQRRANAVKDYLIAKGVKANRIKTISYGKEKPEFLGSGESIWAKNRRGVIVISK